jgi:hypothetical protein
MSSSRDETAVPSAISGDALADALGALIEDSF